MCQENKLSCVVCGKELVRNQQKYCCINHKKKYWRQRHNRKVRAEIKARKIRRKERRKKLIEERLKQDKKNASLNKRT
jgi:hypothetical protein